MVVSAAALSQAGRPARTTAEAVAEGDCRDHANTGSCRESRVFTLAAARLHPVLPVARRRVSL